MKLKSILNQIIKDTFVKAGIEAKPISVSEASKPEFGDYQFNGAMALSKKLGKTPREIASQIIANIGDTELISKTEIAGPGFINIWLDSKWVASRLDEMRLDDRLLIEKNTTPMTTVVDYSSPNMAKQMHVGHLRSTIIGDTLVRLFDFLGDEVILQNHIGDWGTQFGMLIAYMESSGEDTYSSLGDLEQFYKDAKIKFDSDSDFANTAREYVVRLQSGDDYCLKLWQQFIGVSLTHCEDIYAELGVLLGRNDVRAESSYNECLPAIAKELKAKGIATESDGALCVFVDGSDTPLIVQKGDGGFLYATTDLAAIKYRARELEAQRISYVVDARQSGHFKQLFDVAKRAGFVNKSVILEHVSFGMMLDKSGRPFKTRDGGTVKLANLLDEAVARAKQMIEERGTQKPEDIDEVAHTIGIGAVKYAELSVNRQSNYIFDWNKILSFDGNTSLYLQYAYARIQSILRSHGTKLEGKILLIDELEVRLGVMLLKIEDVLRSASRESMPHYVTSYLYELSTLFMKFYEHNPILKNNVDPKIRDSRLLLADLTAKTIRQGLDILGIKVLDKL
ncbi:MAG: arginine--tRNA ligase [Sulfurovum sp.]|nr:arginine--tRNA ligase [Sulfurovum sp.]